MPARNGWRVLCGEPQNFSRAGLQSVKEFARLTATVLSQERFARDAANYDAVMVRLQLRLTKDIIAEAKRLKAIISPTTGLDHIDLRAASSRGVKVFSLFNETRFLRGVCSSAEHSFGLLLSLARRIPSAVESVKHHQWQPHRYRGMELRGKTFGLIGCGRVGAMVARYARAFGMRVLGYDSRTKRLPRGLERRSSLAALLQDSQVVSIHVPLNEATRGLLGSTELGLLPKGALLVNTSRGAVVDEAALLAHLHRGHLGGAALDVLAEEPLGRGVNHPLIAYARTHTNLLITPHIAGATQEAVEKTDLFVITRFKTWVNR